MSYPEPPAPRPPLPASRPRTTTTWQRHEMRGVPLDPDQHVLDKCAFIDCPTTSMDQPLHGIIYDGLLQAVCDRCLRNRIEKAVRSW